MPEESAYKINNSSFISSDKCVCGHTFAAHGSRGLICAACKCKEFKLEFDPKEPKRTAIDDK